MLYYENWPQLWAHTNSSSGILYSRTRRKYIKVVIKFVLTAFLALSLTGCGDPKIDSSSDETMKESVQIIMSELSEDDQKRFMKTLKGIYFIFSLLVRMDKNKNKSKAEIKASINEELDGKTAEDIFNMANEITIDGVSLSQTLQINEVD